MAVKFQSTISLNGCSASGSMLETDIIHGNGANLNKSNKRDLEQVHWTNLREITRARLKT